MRSFDLYVVVRVHFLSHDSPMSRLCPSDDASHGERISPHKDLKILSPDALALQDSDMWYPLRFRTLGGTLCVRYPKCADIFAASSAISWKSPGTAHAPTPTSQDRWMNARAWIRGSSPPNRLRRPVPCRELALGRATKVVRGAIARRASVRGARRRDRPKFIVHDDARANGIEIETGWRRRRSSSSKTTTIAGAPTNRARRRLRGGGGGDAGDDGGVRASGDR